MTLRGQNYLSWMCKFLMLKKNLWSGPGRMFDAVT